MNIEIPVAIKRKLEFSEESSSKIQKTIKSYNFSSQLTLNKTVFRNLIQETSDRITGKKYI